MKYGLILWSLLVFQITGVSASIVGDNRIADVVEKVGKSVVHITAKENVQTYSLRRGSGFGGLFDFFFKVPNNVIPKERGVGSGFIYDKRGLIITNYHVVEGADVITVDLADGRVFKAVLHGSDPTKDIAILKIEDPDFSGEFASEYVVPSGDSSKLRVGEWVIAIGSPFALDHTVTVGIVSAKGRSLSVSSQVSYDNLIQTDASINPGNSGGPLLNLNGEVVGMNTAINPMGQGLGFAIPINLAMRVAEDVDKYGKVKRSWLGVVPEDVTIDNMKSLKLKYPRGVVLRQILPGTPAAIAGLKEGDVILGINGAPVKNTQILIEKIQEIPVGEKASLYVIRDGEERRVLAKLGEPGESLTSQGGPVEKLGMNTRELRDIDRKRLGLSQEMGGVIIAKVTPGSLADKIGLSEGDVIVQFNRSHIESPQQLNQAISQSGRDGLMFVVMRNGYLMYLDYTP